MNVHLLSHLAETVRHWGPMWVYSCFHFETMNAVLKSVFHGTRDMSEQVYAVFMQLQNVLEIFIVLHSR